MPALLLLTLAVAPCLFWLWFFVRRDRLEPEPRALVARAFFLGAAAVIPAALLELPIPRPLDAVLGAPVIEETVKFLVVYLFIYRHTEFDEPMDGLTYGVACALGFATIENVLYVFGSHSDPLPVAVMRALLSVPGHALWATLWGYGLGRCKFVDGQRGETFVAGGLGLAMLSHALFNLGAAGIEITGWFALLLPIMAILGWRLANRQTRDALMRGPLRDGAMPLPLPGRHQPAPHHPPAPLPPPPVPPPPHEGKLPPVPPPPHEGKLPPVPPPPHEVE
jgi:RsiW-degrading membrane proteinase PrsW (M82 family)